MFNASYGLLNWVLSPFGINHVSWLSRYPMLSLIIELTWQWTPFMMLIVLAGLQSQPGDMLEAARVDGAGWWSTFRELTLPHLRPYIELGVLLGAIYVVNTFGDVDTMTQGGPATATTNIPYFLYEQAFHAYNIGLASAMGVIVVILTIVVASFALRLLFSVFRMEDAK